MQQPERRHVRECKGAGTQAGSVASTCRTEFGDMAERIGAFIAIGCRIRRSADTEGIQNEEKGTRHFSPVLTAVVSVWLERSDWRAQPYNDGNRLANLRCGT